MIRAVVFDFDGVILDTETADFTSWREVFSDHGAELTLDTWAKNIGTAPGSGMFDVYAHLISLASREVEVESVRLVRRSRNDELIAIETIMPGVEEWLDEARRLGLKTGIASSSPSDWVEGHLERFNLRQAFECVRCRDHVTHAKPSPELYLAACEALGVSPGEAIAVEDSPNGVAAAKAAGLYCVGVPNSVTMALDLSKADLRLESLAAATLAEVIAGVPA